MSNELFARFRKTPLCELCKAEPASNFASLDFRDGKLTDWHFCGACREDIDHFVMVDDILGDSASTVEELAVLHQKGTDWKNFMDMMVRFQTATDSFDV